MYSKLRRTWSHNDAHYIPRFTKVFPELKKLSSEELCDRFIELDMDFYCEKEKPINFWIRLTLPFGFILFLLMWVFIPIKFMLTGKWRYSLGKKNRVLNWFKALGLQ